VTSPRTFAGAIILLLGVPIGFASSILFDAGASAILHIVLGACFLLIASAVFDFRLPPWMNWTGGVGIAAAGVVFLLQGISDIIHSQPFANFAYGVLGQYLEKALGYAFILWCIALVFFDSRGRPRLAGFAALALLIVVEIYSYAVVFSGGVPSEAVKLLYLPLFIWLMLEGWKPCAMKA
jgi:hypothetical protein